MYFSTRWQDAQKIFQAQIENGFQLFENHLQTNYSSIPQPSPLRTEIYANRRLYRAVF